MTAENNIGDKKSPAENACWSIIRPGDIGCRKATAHRHPKTCFGNGIVTGLSYRDILTDMTATDTMRRNARGKKLEALARSWQTSKLSCKIHRHSGPGKAKIDPATKRVGLVHPGQGEQGAGTP